MGKKKRQKDVGGSAFDDYYQDEYQDRWESLKNSLKTEPQFARLQYQDCAEYYIGRASALVALVAASLFSCAKDTDGKGRVLDMCAAPGGKSILLCCGLKTAQNVGNLDDATAPIAHSFILNDSSAERIFRLRETIRQCVPLETQQCVTVTCQKGEEMCLSPANQFSGILLDAPCSSERHVFTNSKYLNIWTPSRVKALAQEQWALLSGARIMTAAGGYIVYSTCALASRENDGVVERLLQKHNDTRLVFKNEGDVKTVLARALENCDVMVDEDKDAVANLHIEPTKYGYAILPDANDGSGPMYFAAIQRSPT